MKRVLIVLIVLFDVSNILSQDNKGLPDNKMPQPFKVISVPRGARPLELEPSDSSEIIKYNIEIMIDSGFFTLKADDFKNGVHHSNFLDTIYYNRVFKDEKIFFEIIPDISNPSKMGLFVFFPGMSRTTYLTCEQNEQIKYKKMDVKHSTINWKPLLICYVDDMQNNTEKLLEKYFKDDMITFDTYDDIQSKMLIQIEKCILVYYCLTDK